MGKKKGEEEKRFNVDPLGWQQWGKSASDGVGKKKKNFHTVDPKGGKENIQRGGGTPHNKRRARVGASIGAGGLNKQFQTRKNGEKKEILKKEGYDAVSGVLLIHWGEKERGCMQNRSRVKKEKVKKLGGKVEPFVMPIRSKLDKDLSHPLKKVETKLWEK